MKVKHYITPRACGKSTFAKDLQMELPDTTLLLSGCSEGVINRRFWGDHFDRIIFDDFMYTYGFFKINGSEVRFTDWFLGYLLPRLNADGELILISTPDRLRNSSSYLLGTQGIRNKDQIKNDFVNKDKIINEIKEFHFLFLLPSKNIEVIKTNFGFGFKEEFKKRQKAEFNEEEYLTQIEGNFLK